MKLKILFLSFCLAGSALNAFSQSPSTFCDARFTPAQQRWLQSIQLNGSSRSPLNKSTVFVPVKAHIVGTTAGTDYYPLGHLLDAMCNINEDFASMNLRFYLKGNVNFVNNTELFNFSYETYWQHIGQHLDAQAINIFFVNSTPGFCGVYMGGDDIIVIKNDCQRPAANTLTHELGHFFGLPHTFSGWENGNTPTLDMREKKDKSNCTFAGDGFCDTEPDYVATRWNCPTGPLLSDPNGVQFRPDGTLYMSYANDECMTRFSAEQQATMQANQQMRGNSGIPVSTDTPAAVVLHYPEDGFNDAPTRLQFKWNRVEGADFYELQIVNVNGFSIPLFDFQVNDTVFTANKLPAFRPLQWRVRAVKRGVTCSPFSEIRTFTTGDISTSVNRIIQEGEDWFIENPVKANQHLYFPANISVQITDLQGRLVSLNNHSWLPQPGFYSLMLTGSNGKIKMKKIVVSE